MIEVKLKVPEKIAEIIPEISYAIYAEALKKAVRQRLIHFKKRIEEIKTQIAVYEAKYGKSYDEFSAYVPDTLEGHDDWAEWSYLHNVYGELSGKR
jgi:hypothetical protein